MTLRPGNPGTWNAAFYHYNDGWCTQPSFTIEAQGTFNIVKETSTKYGYKADFDLGNLYIIKHSEQTFAHILRVTHEKCPKAGFPNMTTDSEGRVFLPSGKKFKFGKDAYKTRTCRSLLGLDFYTFKLVRMLSYYKESPIFDELYFGVVPTHKAKRSYVPDAYQYLLKRSTSGCQVCKAIIGAKSLSSPVLSVPKDAMPAATGEWVSDHCEAQKEIFQTRYMRFYGIDRQGAREWKLIYFVFTTPDCNRLSYIIKAYGDYSEPVASNIVAGAVNMTLNVRRLKITPLEPLVVSLLKAAAEGTCGDKSEWKPGVEQDVTSTKGCSSFGLEVPTTNYDLVKVLKRDSGGLDLYTGQTSTDNIQSTTPDKRPTSFRVPLRRCGDLTKGVAPLTTGKPTEKKTVGIRLPFTIPRGGKDLLKPKSPKVQPTLKVQPNFVFDNGAIETSRDSLLLLLLLLALSLLFHFL